MGYTIQVRMYVSGNPGDYFNYTSSGSSVALSALTAKANTEGWNDDYEYSGVKNYSSWITYRSGTFSGLSNTQLNYINLNYAKKSSGGGGSTSETYCYYFRYRTRDGTYIKSSAPLSKSSGAGRIEVPRSEATIPDGYESTGTYGVYKQEGATYNYNTGRWTVTSTTSPGAGLMVYCQPITYTATIKYYANGGNGPSYYTQTVSAQTTTISFKPLAPIKCGFEPPTNTTFGGWGTSANSTRPSYELGSTYNINSGGYLELYAIWKHKYNIYFNSNGGAGGMESMIGCEQGTWYYLNYNQFTKSHTITYKYNYSGKSDSSVKANCSFSHWTCNGTRYADHERVKDLATSGSVTMYAQWNNYSVTLPNPIRTGYIFEGWYDANGNYVGAGNSQLTGNADRTLYAHWKVDVIAPSISYSSHTDTSITVSLERNGAAIGSWVAEASTSSSFSSIVASSTTTSTSQGYMTISNLSPDRSYYIRVRHVNGSSSAPSNTVMASTRISQFQWTSNDASNVTAGVNFSSAILASKWNELISKVDWCRRKSGLSSASMNNVAPGNVMTASMFNLMRNAIASMDGGVVGTRSKGDEIKAAYFANSSSSLKTTINAIITRL